MNSKNQYRYKKSEMERFLETKDSLSFKLENEKSFFSKPRRFQLIIIAIIAYNLKSLENKNILMYIGFSSNVVVSLDPMIIRTSQFHSAVVKILKYNVQV